MGNIVALLKTYNSLPRDYLFVMYYAFVYIYQATQLKYLYVWMSILLYPLQTEMSVVTEDFNGNLSEPAPSFPSNINYENKGITQIQLLICSFVYKI